MMECSYTCRLSCAATCQGCLCYGVPDVGTASPEDTHVVTLSLAEQSKLSMFVMYTWCTFTCILIKQQRSVLMQTQDTVIGSKASAAWEKIIIIERVCR